MAGEKYLNSIYVSSHRMCGSLMKSSIGIVFNYDSGKELIIAEKRIAYSENTNVSKYKYISLKFNFTPSMIENNLCYDILLQRIIVCLLPYAPTQW